MEERKDEVAKREKKLIKDKKRNKKIGGKNVGNRV